MSLTLKARPDTTGRAGAIDWQMRSSLSGNEFAAPQTVFNASSGQEFCPRKTLKNDKFKAGKKKTLIYIFFAFFAGKIPAQIVIC